MACAGRRCDIGVVDVEAERPDFGGQRLVTELRRRLQPVLHQQAEVVALIQHLDANVGIELPQPSSLAILLRDELLVERRDLDVEVVRRKVEVGSEGLRRIAVTIAFEDELPGLVLPRDVVEVEQLGELPLRVVREPDPLVRQPLDGQPPCAPALFPSLTAARRPAAPTGRADSSSWIRASSSSTTVPSGTMFRTP